MQLEDVFQLFSCFKTTFRRPCDLVGTNDEFDIKMIRGQWGPQNRGDVTDTGMLTSIGE